MHCQNASSFIHSNIAARKRASFGKVLNLVQSYPLSLVPNWLTDDWVEQQVFDKTANHGR